jgi:chromosome partitioning protein
VTIDYEGEVKVAKIFAIANQKGGVGKTTTAVNLSASLAAAEKRTLLIDMDPQANACSGLGIDKTLVESTVYNVLLGEMKVRDVIRETELSFLQVLPSNTDLIGAEIELLGTCEREKKLSHAISEIQDDYEYIIIDCPPSLSLLTVNALTAADSVLVPLQCEFYAMEGLGQLMQTIRLVQQELNPRLIISGILLTMHDGRNNLCRQVSSEIKSHFGDKVFNSVVPRNVRLSEAPSYGQPALMYDIASKGAQAYMSLAQEVLQAEGQDV